MGIILTDSLLQNSQEDQYGTAKVMPLFFNLSEQK